MTPVPPTPRAILPTHPAPIGKAIARLFLLAVFAATLVLWFGLLHEWLFKAIGRDVSASVHSTREVRTSSGPRKYFADVTYILPGQAQRSDTLRINWTAHRRMSMPAILSPTNPTTTSPSHPKRPPRSPSAPTPWARSPTPAPTSMNGASCSC